MIQPASDLMAFNIHARGQTELIAHEPGEIGRITLVVADDPDGEYDSPRLPDITNQVFGGEGIASLRYCPEAQP